MVRWRSGEQMEIDDPAVRWRSHDPFARISFNGDWPLHIIILHLHKLNKIYKPWTQLLYTVVSAYATRGMNYAMSIVGKFPLPGPGPTTSRPCY